MTYAPPDHSLRDQIAAFYNDYHTNRARQPNSWMLRHYWPAFQGRTLEPGGGTLLPPDPGPGYCVIDISPEAALRASKAGITALVADGTQAPLANGSFDTVACYDVLEHILQPAQFLAEMCRIARRRVIVAGPNYVGLHPGGLHRYLPLRLWAYLTGSGRDCPRLEHPHLRFDADWVPDRDAVAAPNAGWVANQLERAGMRIVQLRSWEHGHGYFNAIPAVRCLGPFLFVVGERS